MNKKQKFFGILLFITCTGGGLVWGVATATDGGDWEQSDQHGQRRDVASVQNTLYDGECGSCHFPYQPGLLPARSWEKLMTGLAAHFGENAELAADSQRQVTEFLCVNAADRVNSGKSKKFLRSIQSDETPLRITETRYFQHEHQKISQRAWKENPQVVSLSRCETCHTQAAQGSFAERDIHIPGIGRWEE